MRHRAQRTQSGKFITKLLLVVALGAMLFALSVPVEAQQPAKTARIGLLGGMSASTFAERMEVFRQQLRELGYIEGKNIVFEQRWADGKLDRLGDMASDLVKVGVEVLVTFGGPTPVAAAKKVTTTVPIVMASGGSDPVAAGFIAILARPGGNITGLANSFSDLRAKQVELLKEVIPKLARVSYLWHPSGTQALSRFEDVESDARALGVRIQSLEFRKPGELEKLFSAAKQERVGAILVGANAFMFTNLALIADTAAKNRLPTIHPQREFVEAGGLMMYGPSEADIYRRAAIYVDKILKGAKPAELPVERPAKFQLIFNLKTAKQIGLTIPPNVLARADRVIR